MLYNKLATYSELQGVSKYKAGYQATACCEAIRFSGKPLRPVGQKSGEMHRSHEEMKDERGMMMRKED
jgi:hypothetical protein